jgi:molecular chaperone DnaK (HSP70)
MPAGFARIDVRLLIDANGILNVTARDARTGKEQSVEVKPSYGLTEEQVEAMIRESIEKGEEDLKERQVREARVEADHIVAATEKAQLSEAWWDLTDEERKQIETAKHELLTIYCWNSSTKPR